jgi:DNA polymerase-3 subunit alpha
MFLIFDTETTGLPKNWNAPITDTDNWPRCIQIAWQLHDEMGRLIEHKDYLVKPDGFTIPFESEKIHGISTDLALEQGEDLDFVLEEFKAVLAKTKFVVGQNVGFDNNIMGCELYRREVDVTLSDFPVLDTCTEVTASLCQLPGGRGGKFKLPNLTELHQHLFGTAFLEAHNATADVEATTRCFLELIRLNVFKASELQVEENYFQSFREVNPEVVGVVGLTHTNLKKASNEIRERQTAEEGGDEIAVDTAENLEYLKDIPFSHLHNHTQFSILQSTIEVNGLIAKAAELGMPGVALTDTGNMMAAFHFVAGASKHNKGIKNKIKELEAKLPDATSADEEQLIDDMAVLQTKIVKPIIGCEFNICTDHANKQFKDNGFQVPMLAKNKAGYHNLAKMSSAAFVDGFYYIPRIDKTIVESLKGDIIALTGGINGEVPRKILNEGEQQAEEAFQWWHQQFGDDFYVEIIRHGLEEEKLVNKVLLQFARKYNVKCIAANNCFYLGKEEAGAHDILLCVKDGEKRATPKGRGRGFRYGFPNDEFYFKSQDEMKELFVDMPDAIENTNEIIDKIEVYELARDVLLPAFDIPEEFQDPKDAEDPSLKIGENNFLRHLTYEGAKKRYGEITEEITERIDFELETIARTGYPGYFLIVQDFIAEARNMGVSVGPGRGSAAGSVVAYCTGITNIDPIKYDLLFERFLNPERVSMPDIDIDFDDEGRGRVIQYVIDKYGASQVAQIVTYGTMAAKSSIRDTGRVLDLPLPDTDRIAKLVPDVKLNKLFAWDEKQMASKLNAEQIEMANQLKTIYDQDSVEGEVLRQARVLEGSVRNTGIHACGVIITPNDIREYVPVALAKDSGMWSTQFDNSVAESAGLLKMDFLGLKTLTLIKDAIKIVKARHGIEIDIEAIPLDDEKTYELFQRGETVGIFQYESPGMQKHMKALKPTVFGDLIAMNALYRPGPMEYIPSFIRRKHGEEEIIYDLDACEEYLDETYGITVYQEQVMLLSQKLAGFTKGEADTLRKAMGKKKLDLLAQLKPQFLDQGEGNGHDREVLGKIWKDWEAFASYAFNKSHSTCYAWIAYQTAYLKAHYPAEYMASVLSNNMNDIKSVTFFMEECKRMGMDVLGPDVNESYYKFAVNKDGAVRFGLGAVKGVGEGAVDSITQERKENGNYITLYDLVKRVNLKAANKKCFENLVLAGALDSLGNIHRAQYFVEDLNGTTFLEQVLKFGAAFQASQDAPPDLFGDTEVIEVKDPVPQPTEKWNNLEELSREKAVVGIFISGHPLDDFALEVKHYCKSSVGQLNNLNAYKGHELVFGCVVNEIEHRMTKKGKPFGTMEIEDYTDSYKLFFFSDDYVNLRKFMIQGYFLYVKGKVQSRKWGDPNELEFKVTSIELLSEILDKKAKGITVELPLASITDDLVVNLRTTFESHKGNCRVKFFIYDPEERVDIHMPSMGAGIDLSKEFIEELEAIPEIEKYALT